MQERYDIAEANVGTRSDGFRHQAYFYDSDVEYVDRVVEFIHQGIDLGEPVVVRGGSASRSGRSGPSRNWSNAPTTRRS